MKDNENGRENSDNQIEFSGNAWDLFYNTVDQPDFSDMEASAIYDALLLRIRCLSFGDYLKRYIYRYACMKGDYTQIPLETYESILKDAFHETATPCSFKVGESTTKVSALVRNCLTRPSVKRETVLLLGFALRITVPDVNLLLTKGLGEPELDMKSPREVICRYCYLNRHPFSRYTSLWKNYCELPAREENAELMNRETTARFGSKLRYEAGDAELIKYLGSIKVPDGTARLSVSAGQAFLRLYAEARRLTAADFNAADDRDFEYEFTRRAERIADDTHDRKLERIRALRNAHGSLTADDITAADLESVLCAYVPKSGEGNLTSADESALAMMFSRYRVSRQHIHGVLSGRIPVSRFDLLTMLFYNWGLDIERHPNQQKRLSDFENAADELLQSCGMDAVYIQNPYECFLLMCMVSEDPLGAYAEVWELAYRESETNMGKT